MTADSDSEVAVKLLRPDLAADPGVRGRFEHEARAAARLSHPAIVTVFDSGEHDGVPYLVMERLPGSSLADELAVGPVDPDRVGAIALRVAGALATAHAAGIVHRDVKPGNLLLTEEGDVKLADFGIATSAEISDRTATGMVVGTPAYLAPERLAGGPATTSTDVYSLGVVLYEALTGSKPFAGDSPVVIAHAIHATSPTPIASCMPAVDPTLGCRHRPGHGQGSGSPPVHGRRAVLGPGGRNRSDPRQLGHSGLGHPGLGHPGRGHRHDAGRPDAGAARRTRPRRRRATGR